MCLRSSADHWQFVVGRFPDHLNIWYLHRLEIYRLPHSPGDERESNYNKVIGLVKLFM